MSEGIDFSGSSLWSIDNLNIQSELDLSTLPGKQPRLICDLRERLNLTQEGFARLFGVSIRTVWRWEHGKASPDSASRERLVRLRTLIEQVGQVLPRPALVTWLTTPVPDLRNQAPIELISSGFGSLSVLDWVKAKMPSEPAPLASGHFHS